MEKLTLLRSLYRSGLHRPCRRFSSSASGDHHRQQLRDALPRSSSRSFFKLAHPLASNRKSQFPARIGSTRSFSEDVAHMPDLDDTAIVKAFKGLMAASWDKLPNVVVHDAKKAVSKNTDDKAGQEALANVFRAAEAAEEFSGMLENLKMELDDSVGMSGENVKPLSKEVANALEVVFKRYNAYLNAFGPEESYLRKKVEMELGTKMIHLKMRCAGLNSKWGKVSVLGTSGLSGSYVEQRA